MTNTQPVVWTQWPDLDVPGGAEALSGPVADLSTADLERISVYVPRYLGGRRALEPIRAMPQLSVVQLPNAGYDGVAEFLRPGMTLCNAQGVHDESTAELAVTLTLASLRGLPEFSNAARNQHWATARYASLTDARVALVGHGSIGRVIERMLSGFAVDVVPFSRRGAGGARPVSELPDAIGTFDVVILIVPLTDATRHLMDADMLSRMRDGALLVNVARGGVVDTAALLTELEAGRLHAAIDVVDPEPLPVGHPLWSAPNCLITPHVGGNTTAFEPRMRALIRSQLERLLRGDRLQNVVLELERMGPPAG